MSKAKFEGKMDAGDEDESSSDEEDGAVETEFAEAPPQPVTETPAPPPSKPPAKLEDSDEDEPEEPKQVANALAEISLKPKAGRSAQGLLFKNTTGNDVTPMTAPSYGDAEWGRENNDPATADVALSALARRPGTAPKKK
jgi:hypothetical protein|mmetsp:Transcript_17777/g.30881  ORF Transcript_17777/g.30881 Transcript_17777/m.30881 type:complete len:140 (+) Transcript_17777:94-513(+)